MAPEFLQSVEDVMSSCIKRTSNPTKTTACASYVSRAQPAAGSQTHKNFLSAMKIYSNGPSSRRFSQEPGIPRCPHRKTEANYASPSLGIGTPRGCKTIHLFEEKPIVRAPWPKDVTPLQVQDTRRKKSAKKAKPPRTTINEVETEKLKYQTTSRRAAEEYALPVFRGTVPRSTVEESTDPVSLRVPRYHKQPANWQRVAALWDRYQLRMASARAQAEPEEVEKTLPYIPEDHVQVTAQQNDKVPALEDLVRTKDSESELLRMNPGGPAKASFKHPIPGYAGYLPRLPIRQRVAGNDDYVNDTTSNATYRALPREVYVPNAGFSRKSPLSSTITLTWPYNSFREIVH